QKALAVFVLRRGGRHALGLLLGKNGIEALRQRRIVEPERVVIPARLEDVDRIAEKRRLARNQRRQISGHAKAQGVQTDEKNVRMLKSASLQRRDHRLHQWHRRGESRTRVGVNLEPNLLLWSRNQFASGRLLKRGNHLLDLALVG